MFYARTIAQRCRCYRRRLLFYEYDLRLPPVPAMGLRDLPGVSFAQATAADLAELPDYIDELNTRAQIQQLVAAGAWLYLIRVNDELAWMGWAISGVYFNRAIDQRTQLPAGVADIHGVYTRPAWRNRGLARRGHFGILGDLRRRGLQRAILQVHTHNTPSIRAIEHAGFTVYQHLTYLRLAYLRFYRFDRAGSAAGWVVRTSKLPDARFDRLYLGES